MSWNLHRCSHKPRGTHLFVLCLGKLRSSCMYCYHHFYLHVWKCHKFVKDQTKYAEDYNAFFKQILCFLIFYLKTLERVGYGGNKIHLLIFCICGSVLENLILWTWALIMLLDESDVIVLFLYEQLLSMVVLSC